MNKYRITQYKPGAWCIEQLFTYGAKSKKAAQTEWKPIKYPGTLAQASKRLLSLVIGTDMQDSVEQLENAVSAAESRITADIAAYVNMGTDK